MMEAVTVGLIFASVLYRYNQDSTPGTPYHIVKNSGEIIQKAVDDR